MLELPLSMPSFFYYGAFDGLCLPEKKYANLEKNMRVETALWKTFHQSVNILENKHNRNWKASRVVGILVAW